MSFQVNPLNYDLVDLKNEAAISRSIRNLVYTITGERFFTSNLGSKISQSLFENIDDISSSVLKDEIENVINNYEPRVKLIKVEVSPNYDEYTFDVYIQYNIIGIDVLPQQLSFALQSTR